MVCDSIEMDMIAPTEQIQTMHEVIISDPPSQQTKDLDPEHHDVFHSIPYDIRGRASLATVPTMYRYMLLVELSKDP